MGILLRDAISKVSISPSSSTSGPILRYLGDAKAKVKIKIKEKKVVEGTTNKT